MTMSYSPQATLASGSSLRCASNTASLIWSHILSKNIRCDKTSKGGKNNIYFYSGLAISDILRPYSYTSYHALFPMVLQRYEPIVVFCCTALPKSAKL